MEKEYKAKGVTATPRAIAWRVKHGKDVQTLQDYDTMRALMDLEQTVSRDLVRKLNNGDKGEAIRVVLGGVGRVVVGSNFINRTAGAK